MRSPFSILTAMDRVLLDQKIFIFWIYYDFFHNDFFQKKNELFQKKINVYFRKTACVHGKFGKKSYSEKKVFPEKVICPQKWPKWPLKRILAHVIPTKNIFCKKNWSKTVICGLSSGQTNLHPPIWGHGRQLDDRHRNPNINIREIIWLGNQLCPGSLFLSSCLSPLWLMSFLAVRQRPPPPSMLQSRHEDSCSWHVALFQSTPVNTFCFS